MLPFFIVTVSIVFGIRMSGGIRSSGISVGIPPSTTRPLPGCKSKCIVDRVRTAITRAGISCESLFICAIVPLVPEDQSELTIYRRNADPHAIPRRDAEHHSCDVSFHIGVDRPTVVELNDEDTIVLVRLDCPRSICVLLCHDLTQRT